MDRKAYWSVEKAEEERLAGNENFKKGNYPDAIKHYNEGLKRVPDDDKVYCVYIFFTRLQYFQDTLAKFYSNRAGAYMKLMDFNRAKNDCDECIKINPTFIKAWIRKGAVLEAMKQHDKAIDAYQVLFQTFVLFLRLNLSFRKLSNQIPMQRRHPKV